MGIINKLFSSVNGLYNNFNLITLSGVNDVIVVRGHDNKLSCSPFQLRFSKIKFYNSKSKIVHLYVNGRLTDISMTITSMGDLFFEEQKAIDNINYSILVRSIENNEILINSILENKIVELSHKFCYNNYEICKTIENNSKIELLQINNNINNSKTNLNYIKTIKSDSNSNKNDDNLFFCKSNLITQTNISNFVYKNLHNNNDNLFKTSFIYFDDNMYTDITKNNFFSINKSSCFLKFFENERRNNLKMRTFTYKNIFKYYNNFYYELTDQYTKISIFLNSAEHYINLLERQKMLLFFMECAINNKGIDEYGAEISFSSCLNNKVEKTLDDTFNKYLVREIDEPENIVVRIEGLIGRGRKYFGDQYANNLHDPIFNTNDKNLKKIINKNNGHQNFSKFKDKNESKSNNYKEGTDCLLKNSNGSYLSGSNYIKDILKTKSNESNIKILDQNNNSEKLVENLTNQSCNGNTKDILYKNSNEIISHLNNEKDVIKNCKSEQVVQFYLPYRIFTKMFFELRHSRNKMSTLVKFLEDEHNRSLGWNIFWSKTPIKSDIGFSLKLDSNELELLQLKSGKNDVVFKISGQPVQLSGNIYLWDVNDKIIVTDIDGTITKSDILGHLYNFVGKDWTHNGVAELFSQIVKNNYRIIYLTARALGQSNTTRNYLKAVDQNSFTLPDGPIILSPDGIFSALYREVIAKKPEDFKIHCLETIKDLFGGINPFFAGFGNKVSDAYTYKVLGILNNRIYTINPDGKLLAEYTQSLVGTYHTMNEFIDSIFPNTKETSILNDHDYSDFKWWR